MAKLPKINYSTPVQSLGRWNTNLPVQVARTEAAVAKQIGDAGAMQERVGMEIARLEMEGNNLDRQNRLAQMEHEFQLKQIGREAMHGMVKSAIVTIGILDKQVQDTQEQEAIDAYNRVMIPGMTELGNTPYRMEPVNPDDPDSEMRPVSNADVLVQSHEKLEQRARQAAYGYATHGAVRSRLQDQFSRDHVEKKAKVVNQAFEWKQADLQGRYEVNQEKAILRGEFEVAEQLTDAALANGLLSGPEYDARRFKNAQAKETWQLNEAIERIGQGPDSTEAAKRLSEKLKDPNVFGFQSQQARLKARELIGVKQRENYLALMDDTLDLLGAGGTNWQGGKQLVAELADQSYQELGLFDETQKQTMLRSMRQSVSGWKADSNAKYEQSFTSASAHRFMPGSGFFPSGAPIKGTNSETGKTFTKPEKEALNDAFRQMANSREMLNPDTGETAPVYSTEQIVEHFGSLGKLPTDLEHVLVRAANNASTPDGVMGNLRLKQTLSRTSMGAAIADSLYSGTNISPQAKLALRDAELLAGQGMDDQEIYAELERRMEKRSSLSANEMDTHKNSFKTWATNGNVDPEVNRVATERLGEDVESFMDTLPGYEQTRMREQIVYHAQNYAIDSHSYEQAIAISFDHVFKHQFTVTNLIPGQPMAVVDARHRPAEALSANIETPEQVEDFQKSLTDANIELDPERFYTVVTAGDAVNKAGETVPVYRIMDDMGAPLMDGDQPYTWLYDPAATPQAERTHKQNLETARTVGYKDAQEKWSMVYNILDAMEYSDVAGMETRTTTSFGNVPDNYQVSHLKDVVAANRLLGPMDLGHMDPDALEQAKQQIPDEKKRQLKGDLRRALDFAAATEAGADLVYRLRMDGYETRIYDMMLLNLQYTNAKKIYRESARNINGRVVATRSVNTSPRGTKKSTLSNQNRVAQRNRQKLNQ